MEANSKKVLIIGWDAADWKIINPLLDSGQMPALSKLINNGVIGNITTLDPPLSPMLWTSIATGKTADKHGIIGFMEPNVEHGGIRPINSTSRKTRALWNILTGVGKKCNVVGWWPSHPAEPINGVMVSNFFQTYKPGKGSKSSPVPKGAIFPEEYIKELSRMRIAPGELTQAHVLPFMPKAAEYSLKEDYAEKYEKRVNSLRKILAENASVHAAATWLMENTEWDLTAVYFDGIDHACHGYIKFHPPQIPGLPDEMFELFKDVVNGMYIFHDMMLARLLELAGKDTTVIILSDHGFHSDHLRKTELPKYAAAPALEHRQHGILCISGNNIIKDELLYGASLLDITPTVLTLLGLPVGSDMDGKILTSIFEKPISPEFIHSWDDVEGDFGTHSSDIQEDSVASAEAMKQLVELGYVEDFGENKAKAMEKTVVECKYNLSRVFISKKDYNSAIAILEELAAVDVEDARFALGLAKCYVHISEYDKSMEMISRLKQMDNKFIPNTDMLEANVLMRRGKHKLALDILKKIEEEDNISVKLMLNLGSVYLKLFRPKDALEAYSKVLNVESTSSTAFYGIGCAYIQTKQFEEAVDSLLNSIGLNYQYPIAHIKLGEALYYLGKIEEASHAFEVSLTMAPKLLKPRRWIQKIYSESSINPEREKMHSEIINKQIKGSVVIVSGLPRSGTSMMMQMLEAGGLEIFTDNLRKPDDNNPKGYLEHEAVKSIARDSSWINQADGKAVKIIAQLLNFLPSGYSYKIIFMQRDMDEIIRSQQKMLGKNPNTFPMEIANAFSKTLEKIKFWSEKALNVEILNVEFKDVIANPDETAEKVSTFLNIHLDLDNMSTAVAPELYRNKV